LCIYDHGIGVFSGLQKIDSNGRVQEAVRILYKDSDILYVNINSLHKISKYTGKEGHIPKVNKLGSDSWQKLKEKTKTKVKEIAFDLIKLYAQRRAQPGFRIRLTIICSWNLNLHLFMKTHLTRAVYCRCKERYGSATSDGSTVMW
jgi:transcription-repair coupling factor (superfamily II helicase)